MRPTTSFCDSTESIRAWTASVCLARAPLRILEIFCWLRPGSQRWNKRSRVSTHPISDCVKFSASQQQRAQAGQCRKKSRVEGRDTAQSAKRWHSRNDSSSSGLFERGMSECNSLPNRFIVENPSEEPMYVMRQCQMMRCRRSYLAFTSQHEVVSSIFSLCRRTTMPSPYGGVVFIKRSCLSFCPVCDDTPFLLLADDGSTADEAISILCCVVCWHDFAERFPFAEEKVA